MNAPLIVRRTVLRGFAAAAASAATAVFAGAPPGKPAAGLVARAFRSPRHTTRYWEAGPRNGPLMIFLHGWPEISLMWRAQIEAFASEGWCCVAPDMRGYGGSSVPASHEDYTLHAIVDDMVELHDHLGARPAIWVGHDWGSPVVGALAAHHAKRCRAVVLVSVSYFQEGFALPNLVPLVDRQLYSIDQYPDGQWDYFRFYPSFFMTGKADGLKELYPLTEDQLRIGVPGLVGSLELDNVGHWIQREASIQVSEQLVKFLRAVNLV
jgi:pimeloyl-ACP methyl ester carboxylesterase